MTSLGTIAGTGMSAHAASTIDPGRALQEPAATVRLADSGG
jgi:hypothetical protein